MLWLPGDAARGVMREAEGKQEAARVIEFRKRLKAIDARLECFLQSENVEELKAGFWYIRRMNEDGTIACWEVRNPDGSFREPDEAVIHWLQSIDSHRTADGGKLARKRARENDARRRDRDNNEKRREFREQLSDRLKFNNDTPSRPKAGWGIR